MAGRNYRRDFAVTANHLATQRGNVPLLRLLLGLVLIGFFLLALLLQIQTSESFLLNGPAVNLAANWAILLQPYDLARGVLPVNMAKAVMWGWGVELVYLVCVVGEVVPGKFQRFFKTGAIVLVIFDAWTDFTYGNLASGMGGQMAFAAITAFVVAFFGVIGLNMVWSAITDFTATI